MKQVFRSTAAQILGWMWVIFAAVMAIDLVVRFNGAPSLVAGAVLAVLTALIVVTSLRPATVLTDEGVLVRNPLRDTFVPWIAVDEVRVAHAIQIAYDGGFVRCWTPQSSARERAAAMRRGTKPARPGRFRTEPAVSRGEQAAVEAMAGRTHADFVADQVKERVEAAKRKAKFVDPPPEAPAPRSTWSGLALGLCLGALAVVIAAVVASL